MTNYKVIQFILLLINKINRKYKTNLYLNLFFL